jgi:hypothetical protein
MIRTYFQMLIEEEMPGAEGKMKQFVSWFTHGVANGAGLRKAVYESRSGAEILARVDEFFAERVGAGLSPACTGQSPVPTSVATPGSSSPVMLSEGVCPSRNTPTPLG